MTSDVVLSSAMRTNLLSLQKTQSAIDVTQGRLSTGKKVNSALDNPQSFFASQALTNRASDLTRLLDGIGQSIQVIQAADNGVTALTKLVEQADSIATQAQDAISSGEAEAKVTGNKNLKGVDDLSSLAGYSAGATLTFSLTKDDGSVRNIDTYGAGSSGATEAITIGANDSTDDLLAKLNSIVDEDNNHVINASLDSSGGLVIKTTNGDNFNVGISTTANTAAANLGLANALGLGEVAHVTQDGTATPAAVSFTSKADTSLKSYSLVDTNGDVATRSTLLTDLRKDGDTSTALFAGIDDAADKFTISLNNGSKKEIDLYDGNAAISVQKFIDDVNEAFDGKVEASFDEKTGQLNITPKDASVKSIEIGVVGDAAGTKANFGFGTKDLTGSGAAFNKSETIQLSSAAGDLAKYEEDFNKIREQIDQLVKDTGYRGTNLLAGDTLKTTFNEDRTSTITTEGKDFSSAGLGLEKADFSRADTIDAVKDQVSDALSSVREFGSSLANDLAVIQTRQDFTSSLVATLQEGSDKLVNADQNEEGAKLLALQTRQSLGVTALSLASQSQQAILRLF